MSNQRVDCPPRLREVRGACRPLRMATRSSGLVMCGRASGVTGLKTQGLCARDVHFRDCRDEPEAPSRRIYRYTSSCKIMELVREMRTG
jgi:hypothetical protein